MQISLKQSEIEVALKRYIESEGINLVGKFVTIDFTAGRKESGITADINIESADTERRQAVNTPVTATVAEQANVDAVVPMKAAAVEDSKSEVGNEGAAAAGSTPTSSLFGGK